MNISGVFLESKLFNSEITELQFLFLKGLDSGVRLWSVFPVQERIRSREARG